MGLQIIVLTNLKNTTVDYPYKYWIYNLCGFEERCTVFEEGFYRADCIASFIAGRYIGFNLFRQELASLAGYDIEEAWEEPKKFKEHAFFEQVEFPDNEGCIDYNVAGRLYQDYVKYEEKAKNHLEFSDFVLYCYFKAAFHLAYKYNGIVMYI